jgi:hypothetical protein
MVVPGVVHGVQAPHGVFDCEAVEIAFEPPPAQMT